MKIKEIVKCFEDFAPIALQEDFDNSGVQIGDIENEITGILISIDITPEIVEEAITHNCNLIVSHHPLIFTKLKKITGSDYVEKAIILAIKNDIAIYCGHTNFDQVFNGVSGKMCEKLDLQNLNILSPKADSLKKIVVFVPQSYSETVRTALFNAGAGNIGNYDNCSYNTVGEGSFRAGEFAHPFVGKIDETHFEKEVRIETIFPSHLENKIIAAVKKIHPYEEPAFDIYKLENKRENIGLGMIGELKKEMTETDFLNFTKEKFVLKSLKHSFLLNKTIKKVAVCGGSGAFLINAAKQSGADIYISGDIKYHDYFLAENKMIIVDIGHYESEQFTKEIFYDIIVKNNPNFAVRFSEKNTNPINTF